MFFRLRSEAAFVKNNHSYYIFNSVHSGLFGFQTWDIPVTKGAWQELSFNLRWIQEKRSCWHQTYCFKYLSSAAPTRLKHSFHLLNTFRLSKISPNIMNATVENVSFVDNQWAQTPFQSLIGRYRIETKRMSGHGGIHMWLKESILSVLKIFVIHRS